MQKRINVIAVNNGLTTITSKSKPENVFVTTVLQEWNWEKKIKGDKKYYDNFDEI